MKGLELFSARRVLVLIGPGGVGKTSCAIGLAVLAARHGYRVGLLSIDPARRLAAALKIPHSYQAQQLEFPEHLKLSGSLDAIMLEQKEVFDRMVAAHAPNEEVAAKILAHPLYRTASESLAGSLEYMALAKLQEMVDNKDYDLVVLDTPPDTQALEFLAKPNVLGNFVDNKVVGWMLKPFRLAHRFGFQRVFSVGERFIGGLSRITGLQAMSVLSDFIILMQQVIEGFHGVGQRIVQTLGSSDCAFILVSSSHSSAVRSGQDLLTALERLGYACQTILLNRTMGQHLQQGLDAGLKAGLDAEGHAWLANLQQRAQRESLAETVLLNSSQGEPCLVKIGEHPQALEDHEQIYRFAEQFLSLDDKM